jgi:hypothetical protein
VFLVAQHEGASDEHHPQQQDDVELIGPGHRMLHHVAHEDGVDEDQEDRREQQCRHDGGQRAQTRQPQGQELHGAAVLT